LDPFPLHADASPVDESHLPESAFARRDQILERCVANFSGTKGMEVERVLDGDRDRLVLPRRILCDTLVFNSVD
jgi:hypothetical protein